MMRIEDALNRCRTLEEIPVLVEALGGSPRCVMLAPEQFPGLERGGLQISSIADVGRFGALPCIAAVGETPDRIAPRLARTSMRRGEPCLIIALPLQAGRLVFAVGGEPPSSLALDPSAPDSMALAMLRRLRPVTGGGRIATALRFADALGGQRVDRRFFEAFRGVRDRFAEEGPTGAPLEDRRALALLHLTRVLFLYFVQQKGWLDGRDDFLGRTVDDHLGRRRMIDRDLLRPLFFGTLNRPEASRGDAVRRFGRIPFLNGGLFEPHALERRWKFVRSNDVWRSAFDDLFERFHFTLHDQGEGGTIAPDMLGRVFEGLMASEERLATGTFYTPNRLVSKLVSAGVGSLLADRLGVDLTAAQRIVEARDPAARQVLARCRVLDPAVGSGAFLLGTLDLFAAVASAGDRAPGHRRLILKRQLFGVDLSAEAVRLAELRLWLSAVQEDPDGPEVEVEPLPNLDAAVRQGDSLHDPRWLAGLRRTPIHSAHALAEARRLFVTESGPGKRGAWRTLRAAEQAAAAESLSVAREDLDRRIAAILEDARMADLFGVERGLDRTLRPMLAEAREDRRRIGDAERRLARDGSLPWFDAQSAFGEVFASSGGFDLVVGNPPWVRGERVPARTREMLAARYRWWAGERGPFSHRPDLAVAFLERSVELTAPGGVVAMLVPSKLATASYATAMRRGLAAEHAIDRLVDLTADEAAGFGAVTYPMAVVVGKRAPGNAQKVSLTLNGPATLPQAQFGAGPWVLRAPDAASVARAVCAEHPTLAAHIPIHLGVKSGCNAAYLRPPASVEQELIRPAVRGRDLAPFEVGAPSPLLYPHDAGGRPIRSLPPGAARHLATFREALEARTDATSGPWWALHRTVPASARHRVGWPDLARQLVAVTLPTTIVPLNSCYFAVAPDASTMHALAGWLNASWCRAIAVLGADPARGGFARFNARAVGRLPWVLSAATNALLIEAARSASKGKDASSEIDRIVAELLGLDARDRRTLLALA